jgi:hypothetical protein
MLMSVQVIRQDFIADGEVGKTLGHHEGCVYEEKVDGWRMVDGGWWMVAYKDGAAVRLMSRQS